MRGDSGDGLAIADEAAEPEICQSKGGVRFGNGKGSRASTHQLSCAGCEDDVGRSMGLDTDDFGRGIGDPPGTVIADGLVRAGVCSSDNVDGCGVDVVILRFVNGLVLV